MALCFGPLQIREDACRTLRNITTGSQRQIQLVLNADLFPRIIKLATVRLGMCQGVFAHLHAVVRDQSGAPSVRKEAVWAVANATECGSGAQLAALEELGAVQGIVSCLSDVGLLIPALIGLENFAQVGPPSAVLCVFALCEHVLWGAHLVPWALVAALLLHFITLLASAISCSGATATSSLTHTSSRYWRRLVLCLCSRLCTRMRTWKCATCRCVSSC